MLMILLSGCGEDASSPDAYVDPVRVELTVPTGHSLPLDERLLQADALSDGKLLYSIDYTDKTIDQPAPDQLDLRYYIYDTATRETAELGKIL